MPHKKFVVLLNKSYELIDMASAIGHVAAGLASGLQPGEASLVTYVDAERNEFPMISDWPFVILRASGGQLKTCRQKLIDAGLPAIAYLDSMFHGGSQAQQEATAARRLEDLTIVALATFGSAEAIDAICRKYSLWR